MEGKHSSFQSSSNVCFSFTAFSNKSENDMRFVFCAASICYILNDFSYIDVEAVCRFIRNCFNYDGGFGQLPHLESHGIFDYSWFKCVPGGSSYCAVASLSLLGHLWDETVLTRQQLEMLKRWALMLQDEGFHGRVNKPDDTCYAFWIGGILSVWIYIRIILFKCLDFECTRLGWKGAIA